MFTFRKVGFSLRRLRRGHALSCEFLQMNPSCRVHQFRSATGGQPSPQLSPAAVIDAVSNVINLQGDKVPIGRLMPRLSRPVLLSIANGGKGIDVWLKSHSNHFIVEGTGAQKTVSLTPQNPVLQKAIEIGCHVPPLPICVNGLYEAAPEKRPPADAKAQAPVYIPSPAEKAALESEFHHKLMELMQPNTFYEKQIIIRQLYGTVDTIKVNALEKHLLRLPRYFAQDKGKLFMWKDPNQEYKVARIVGTYVQQNSALKVRKSIDAMARDWHPDDFTAFLRYTPLCWTELSQIKIPPEVKKNHLRHEISLFPFLARHPQYFDVRVPGNIYVRRSPLLHPEENGITIDQAREYVRNRIACGYIPKIIKFVTSAGYRGQNEPIPLAEAQQLREEMWNHTETVRRIQSARGVQVLPKPFPFDDRLEYIQKMNARGPPRGPR